MQWPVLLLSVAPGPGEGSPDHGVKHKDVDLTALSEVARRDLADPAELRTLANISSI